GRALGLDPGDEGVRLGDEVLRQFAARTADQLGGLGGILLRVLVEQLLPLGLAQLAGTVGAPAVVDLLRDLERRVRPLQRLAGAFDLVLAQRRAVRLFLAGLVRGAEADGGLAADQGRLVLDRDGLLDRGL